MGKKIANGAELARQSWAALRSNPQLLVFPIMSLIGMVVVTILFFIPIAGTGILTAVTSGGRTADTIQSLPMLVVLFAYYLVAYTVTIFSNTALVGAALRLARGETATVQDGINIAMARLSKIIVYALISATVGMIARGISQSGRESRNLAVMIIAAIIGGIIQGAWNLLVFFAIPVMVVEDIGVIDSLKRSLELFKRTWGEGFVGNTAIGGISCLITLAILIVGSALVALAISTGSTALIILAVVLMVLALVVVGLISGAINGVFQASMYQYAITGEAGKLIDTSLARGAFRVG